MLDLQRLLQLAGITESYELYEAMEDTYAHAMNTELLQAYNNDTDAQKPKLDTALDMVNHLAKTAIPGATAGEIQRNKSKFLKAVVTWYAKGGFKLHDVDQVQQDLVVFMRNADANRIQNKDINSNQYADYHAFHNMMGQDEFKLKASRAEQKEMLASEGLSTYGDFVINTPNFKVIRIKDRDAAIRFGKDLMQSKCSWCTSVDSKTNQFDNYKNEGGELMYILAGSGDPKSKSVRKFGYMFLKNEFQNEDNENIAKDPQAIEYLSKFPEYADFLNMEIKKHYNF